MLPNKTRVIAFCFYLWILAAGSLWANPFLGNQSVDSPISETAERQLPQPAFAKPLFGGTQKVLRDILGELFNSFSERPAFEKVWTILAVSFLYGILHSLGPGHRKVIILSYYMAKKAPVWEPFVMGILVSLLHGGTSVVILLLLQGLTIALSGIVSTFSFYFETVTYALLILLSLWLVVHSIRNALLHREDKGNGKVVRIGILIGSSIYPCPGTILILILALALGHMVLGIVSVFFMSIGTSIPIVGFAYLGWFGRKKILSGLERRQFPMVMGKVSEWIQVAGYSMLFVFSIYLFYPYLHALAGP